MGNKADIPNCFWLSLAMVGVRIYDNQAVGVRLRKSTENSSRMKKSHKAK